MNRVRYFAAGALMTALLTTAAATFAQGPRGDGRRGGAGGPAPFGMMPGPGIGIPLRELQLTDAQRQQIKDIRERHQNEARQLGDQLRSAAAAQRAAVESMPVNEELIRSTTQQLAAAESEAAITQAHVRSEILSILTPEQQAQLSKVQADRQARAAQMQQRRLQRQQQ